MKKILIVLLVLGTLVFQQLEAQVNYNESPVITQMMNRFVELNRAVTHVDGWRIQVMATPDRVKMDDALQRFQYNYPNIAVDWVHDRPYYKLRAGAFATRLEALQMLDIVKQDYPSAYPTKDSRIRPAELIF